MPRGLRTSSAYIAAGCSGLLALAALNLAADRTGAPGLVKLRNYLVRANGAG